MRHRRNEWKSSLAKSELLSDEDIEELDIHLDDIMDDLSDLNLSEDENFLLATHRIGYPNQLAREFEKAIPSRSALGFISAGISAIIIYKTSALISLLIASGVCYASSSVFEMNAVGYVTTARIIYSLFHVSFLLIFGFMIVRKKWQFIRLRNWITHPGKVGLGVLLLSGLYVGNRFTQQIAMNSLSQEMPSYDNDLFAILSLITLTIPLVIAIFAIPFFIKRENPLSAK